MKNFLLGLFLGVVLATLALSIQSFSSTPIHIYRPLLILSWGLWLISFVAGFFRIERTISFLSIETGYLQYKVQHERFTKAQFGEIEFLKAPGEPWSPEELKEELGKIDSLLQFTDTLKKRRIKQSRVAYHISKWCYFSGILSYIVFRGVNLFVVPAVQN